MAITPSLDEQEVLADTLRRDGSSITTRQLCAALAPAVLFLAAQAALLAHGQRLSIELLPAAACLVVLFAAEYIRIDLPFAYTVPTQLGLVPLWFVVSPALVPVLVMLVIGVHDLVDALRGELRASRLVSVPANAAHVIAPAAILVVADVAPRSASLWLLAVALMAQFELDFVLSALRQAIARGASLSAQLAECWIYGVDFGLSCVALVVAKEMTHSPWAVLALLPLLAIFR